MVKLIITILLFLSGIFNIYSKNNINININNIIKYENFIDSIFNADKMTGLSVIVTHENKIIFQTNFGYKDINAPHDEKNRISSQDLYRIASISKSFISAVLFKLKEEGKISFQEDAQKYLPFKLRNPNYPDTPITIEMLMSHTSSINDSCDYVSIDVINPKSKKFCKKSYSNTYPGEKYNYSNLNYNLLATVIENVTQERFDKVMDKYILNPLNINGGYNILELDTAKFVKLYRYNASKKEYFETTTAYKNYFKKDNYLLGMSTFNFLPCGGLKISAYDLSQFMIMLMNNGWYNDNQILSHEIVNAMKVDYKNNNTNYGMGIAKYKSILPNKIFYGATGRALGVNSAMIFDLEDKIGFIIISSGTSNIYEKGMNLIHKPIIKEFYKLFIN